ncbi:MAG TPA: hypothetical protein VJ044_02640, partial [Candidatus Hodarchaeales archaeon]|nr:hypothetical protein [Candidatus Hodarchaeales archaeon]
PGVGDVMLIPNISFIFNPYGVVSPTFNTSMQALIPYLYNLSGNQNWITVIFQPTLLENSSVLLNPFLVTVPVNFAPVLGVASIPFVLFRDVSNILLFGLLFFFLGLEFVTIIVQPDPKKPQLEKSIFSVTDTIPTAEEIERDTSKYFVMRNFGLEPLVDANGMPTNRPLTSLESAIYNMELGKEGELGQIIMEFTGETPISFADLGKEMQTRLKDVLSFFSFVNKTAFAREHPFTVIRREYGFGYEEAKVDSLHIMMTDGRSVFTHSFAEESSVEPALVAGLFSAITSFAKEAVKAEKLLRTIDHGDIVLIIEYGRFVFSVLFADRQTIELRSKLSKFLTDFENKHAEVLESWLGDTSYFAEDWQLVSSIFGE